MPAAPEEPRRRLGVYLAPLIGIPLCLLFSAFFIVPTDWVAARSGNLYLMNLGYGTKLVNKKCEVLIYGDSGAMIGADPGLIQARTGLSVCNIAEFQGMTRVNGTLPLDVFLAHNPRPNYLIFLYAPANLQIPFTWAGVATFEAISFRLQQRPGVRTLLLLAAHPLETLSWAQNGLRLALIHFLSPPAPSELLHAREERNGQLKIPSARTLSGCEQPVYLVVPDATWLAGLRKRYATAGTQVLIDAIPTADCDPNNAWNEAHLNGLIDNDPNLHFPYYAFTEEGLGHTNDLGSRLISSMLADQIQRQARAGARPPL